MEDKNIVKVNKARWLEALEWQEKGWINVQQIRRKYGKNYLWRIMSFFGLKPKYRGDDWNYWWKREFNNYEFLSRMVDNAIELGCGPYTNMRLIMEKCRPEHLFLSDPLMKTYVNFELTFVSQYYKINFCTLDDHSIEELPFANNYFDLAVMTNVLDHVRDAELCMKNAINIIKPGGILIIGQDLTNLEDLQNNERLKDDIGHPIRLDHSWLNQFINDTTFEKIIFKILPREKGRKPEAHYGTYIFAGKKLESQN